jgi:nucleosome assembly protein 1-like 1
MFSSADETVTSHDRSSCSFDHGDQDDDAHWQESIDLRDDRIDALRKLQLEHNRLESQYLRDVQQLEYQFHQQCAPLFERRSAIVNGRNEPNDDECRLITDCVDVNDRSIDSSPLDTVGIPSFWLQTLKQVCFDRNSHTKREKNVFVSLKVSFIADTIEVWDEAPFQNRVLTKFYQLQIDANDERLDYEGMSIIRSLGCHIDWVDETKNLTRNVHTGEEQASFFHFFTGSSDTDEDWKVERDLQIGQYMRENLLPKAILFYTGEIFDDNYDFTGDESDDSSLSFEDDIGEGEHL